SVNEASVASVALTIPSNKLTLTVNQRSVPGLTKQLSKTWSVTEAATLEVYTATNLNGAVAMVSQDATVDIDYRAPHGLAVQQSAVADLSFTVILGTEHTTIQKALAITPRASVTSLGMGSQVIKEATQASRASLDFALIPVDLPTTYFPPDLIALQPSVASMTLHTTIIPHPPPGNVQPTGGWLEAIPRPIPPREPTAAEIRKAARDAEQVARRKAKAEAEAEQQRKMQAAEAQVREAAGMLAKFDLLDAAIRPQYEAQIKHLQDQLAFAQQEIMALRAQLQQVLH
ncbi:MAG: hypothetical protein RLZZ200_256, partial [Pseudomonadota bacterium]